eukprot:321605-Pyramimonas_sp.AAC.1
MKMMMASKRKRKRRRRQALVTHAGKPVYSMPLTSSRRYVLQGREDQAVVLKGFTCRVGPIERSAKGPSR